MKSKISIIGLALTVAAILALVNGGSTASSASQLASTAPVGVAAKSTAPLTAVGSGFTYQGNLKNGGSPASGQYDFQFTLYDALAGGNLVGGPLTSTNVTVTVGLFAVTLDFGQSAFTGDARYLEIAVRQTGGGAYTTLTPRQPLTPAPYALSLKPGAQISGAIDFGATLYAINTGTGFGIDAESNGSRAAVLGNSTDGHGVEGNSTSNYGVYGFSSSSYGVYGRSPNNSGVYGNSTTSTGVYGGSGTGIGVFGYSGGNEGVHGETPSNFAGVYGHNTSTAGIGPGVRGDGDSGPGVYGLSPNGNGVDGNSTNGVGVAGHAVGGKGVWGVSTTNDGVYGTSNSLSGVAGISNSGNGVYGTSNATGWAGWFDGRVRITGPCCFMGEGTTQIDHPLDPANKYLNQSTVESPDMINVYSGNVTTDAAGKALVTLPSYVEALNKDFRYQLTVMGQFAQSIVSSKIKDNHFTIKTDKPNVEVSWQVTGIRKDPYAQAHPIQVEAKKSNDEQGKYLYPAGYGQPETMGIGYDTRQRVQQEPASTQEPKP